MPIVTTTLNYIAKHETCYNTLVVDIAHSEDLLNYRCLILLVQKITVLPFGGIFLLTPQFNKPSRIFFQLRLINSFQNFGSYMQDRPPSPQQNFQRLCIYDGHGYFQGPHISNNNCLHTMQQNHLAETLLILKSSFVLQNHSIISSLSTQAQGWTLHPPYFLLVQTAPVHHPENDIHEMKRSQQTTARIAGRKPAWHGRTMHFPTIPYNRDTRAMNIEYKKQ